MGRDTDKPDFSDVQGGVKSTAAVMPPAAKADFSDVQSHVSSTADEATIYTVAAGDNLSKIAKHFYGNANKYGDIARANSIDNPDRIQAGQQINIPPQG